ncbi:TPA: magnesium/cobalt transporter CorA [Thermoplasmata archaeon]|nr:magnesium/cobalt transporter CorA [Thermoplasmata archaeon]
MNIRHPKPFRSLFRFSRKYIHKSGSPPGTLVYTGEKKVERTKITVMEYNDAEFFEREVEDVESCFPLKEKPTVTWLNISGLHDVRTMEAIGNAFGIHPLVLEDILNVDQRPKMEDFENYIFIVLKMAYFDQATNDLQMEQVSLIVTQDCVISFQEMEGDVFEGIRQRIREYKGRTRRMGVDYLAYVLLDAIVDGYFVILDRLGERTESLEIELVSNPDPETMQAIYRLKRDLVFLRRSVWPLREVIGTLEKEDIALVQENTQVYLKDVHDHTIRVIDTVESLRDMATGMHDVYLSSVSNRMNEVMKVLTIIATIFIPLSFVAGLYGMNFRYMPELDSHIAYPLLLIGMTCVGALMLVYFRVKKWI